MAGFFTCPNADDLHRFLLGEPSGMAKDLEKHLLECPSCCKRARTLEAEDTLVSALRTPAIIRYELSDTVEALMERLEGLSPPESASADPSNVTASDASHGEATPTPGNLPARQPLDNTKDLYEFLAPAREPGELGRLGPYRVLKALGAGGMGVVFQAEDSRLKRTVALKVMKPSLAASAGARQRFLREAQMTAAIEHDHIVAIFQADEDRGIPFLAMPLLKGETLDDRLQREGKLPGAEVVRIGREIALGLAAAHDGKLIHRDIKPSNIWLEGKQGRVKILDFGLVRAIDDDANLTSSGAVAGTPRYMAPEQASGTKVDQRCDLFSLGCVLYRMSTGQVPFQGSNTMKVLRSLEMEEPKPPRELNPDLPPALSILILKLLTKDRAGRPGSAAAVAEALVTIERELAANSGAIGQSPALAPARRSMPRGRVPVMAAVLLLALLPLAYWFAPTLIRIATSKGELIVETDGRDVEVSVMQAGVTLHDRVKDRKFELKAGDGEVDVFEAASGLRLFTKKFTIERGGTRIVSVRVELAKIARPIPPDNGSPSPLDRLDPSQILAEERFPWQPTELVAVLGEHRQRHWGVVTGVSFSPDGKVAASSGGDGVRLWDAATMREIAFAKHPRRLSSVAISPDGKTLAAGDPFGVQLWDLSLAGVQERSLLKGDGVHAVAFSSDGKFLAAGGEEKVVRLWDLTGPEPRERAVLKGHTDLVLTLAFAPGGKTLASGSQDKTVRLWDIAGAEPRPGAVLQHKGAVRSLALAGNKLASASEDGSLRLWDLGAAEPKELIVKEGLEFNSFGGSLAFAPDGKSLATAGNNPVVRLWDVSGTELKEQGVLEARLDRQNQGEKPPGGTNYVTSVAFSPDGKTLVSGEVTTVRLWDLATPVPKERGRLNGHASAIQALTFTPDGAALASGGGDATIRLWDLSKPAAQNPRLFSNNLSGVTSLAFSPNGQVLASAVNLQLWDLATAAPRQISNDYWGMFARDGKMLVSGGPDFEVRLWDMGGAEPMQRAGIKGQSTIGVLAPDGKTLACGDANGTLRLWDVSGAEPKQRAVLLKENKEKILSLAFSPDGKTLAAGDWSAKIRLWNLDEPQPKEQAVLEGPQAATLSLAFAPDGKTLACSAYGVQLWDFAARTKLRGWQLPGQVGSVAFAPDGRHLATGNSNGTIYILRLAPAPEPSNK